MKTTRNPILNSDATEIEIFTLKKGGKRHILGDDVEGPRAGKQSSLCGMVWLGEDEQENGADAIELGSLPVVELETIECARCRASYEQYLKRIAKADEAEAAPAKKTGLDKAVEEIEADAGAITVKLSKPQAALLSDVERPDGATLEGTTLSVPADAVDALTSSLGEIEGKKARTAKAIVKKLTA